MPLYLDIETSFSGDITVIGMYERSRGLRQLVGPNLSADDLLAALPPARSIVTFNGSCFDLPLIKSRIGVDLLERYESRDLRFECRRVGLTGGQKVIEKKLGIGRDARGVKGRDAPLLWHLYRMEDSAEALELLLRYNRDDVMNMRRIRMIVKKLEKLQQM